MLKLLSRLWVPLTVMVVVLAGASTVVRLHGALTAGGGDSGTRDESKPFIPKTIEYEIFGAPGSTGVVNYLDERAEPRHAMYAQLPWHYVISTTLTSVFANVVAQGSGSALGCRILVDGRVRDQHTVDEPTAQAFCLVKAA